MQRKLYTCMSSNPIDMFKKTLSHACSTTCLISIPKLEFLAKKSLATCFFLCPLWALLTRGLPPFLMRWRANLYTFMKTSISAEMKGKMLSTTTTPKRIEATPGPSSCLTLLFKRILSTIILTLLFWIIENLQTTSKSAGKYHNFADVLADFFCACVSLYERIDAACAQACDFLPFESEVVPRMLLQPRGT